MEVFWSRCADTYEKKHDIYGLLPATDVTIQWYRNNVVTLSGDQGITNPNAVIRGCYARPANPYFTGIPVIPSAHNDKDKGDEAYSLELLSRTNPFRTTYSVPVMFKELIDISSMFRFTSQSLASTAGSAYLNYRFGWESFIKDLLLFGKITIQLERRLKEIDSLMKAGGLRRKVSLDKYTTFEDPSPKTAISSPAPLWLRIQPHVQYTTEVWATCRWFPAPGAWQELESWSPLERFNQALKAVFDLRTPSPETVWNLIPWTWLIDYFIDIGPRLSAMSNSTLANAEYVCIMRETKMKVTGTVLETSSFSTVSGDYGGEYHLKKRKVLTPRVNLPSSLNFFTENQAKVILALLLKFQK